MGVSSFNEMELDAIGEIMNISLGASATAVSTMLGAAVNITTPAVSILTRDEFEFKKLEPAVGVEITYTRGLDGSNVMMFRRDDVRVIVGMLTGEELPKEDFQLDEINISAICEVMNQMMGSSATALAEFLSIPVNISTPLSFEIEDETSFKEKYFVDGTKMVVVSFALEIEGRLKSEFLNIMSIELTKRLLAPFDLTQSEPVQDGEAIPVPAASSQQKPKSKSEPKSKTEPKSGSKSKPNLEPELEPNSAPDISPNSAPDISPNSAPDLAPNLAPDLEPGLHVLEPPTTPLSQIPRLTRGVTQGDPMMLQLLTQMQQAQVQMLEMMQSMKGGYKQRSGETSLIHPVNADQLGQIPGLGKEEPENQEMLMKVPLEISVEIGRTKKLVRDILEFTQGSLVVLDKMAGEQADLFVNGQCIARGDIVVVEDNFGIRITEILARDINQESL